MKVFGIDDNSEAFSLLITAIIGILLALFSYLLHKSVMGKKAESVVSIASHRVNSRDMKISLFFS